MSYTKTFRKEITVYYSGTVSYPASESGGRVPYEGSATEDVYVEIEVDTTDFDARVHECNSNVHGLTASVGAMNAAQCLAIADNSDKVSQSLIDGFFATVRTDISTQVTEISQKVESRLMLLRQQAQTLREKRQAMEADYARTSARYQKIFDDLNNELSARIHQIDQPVFDVVNVVEEQNDRMLHTDLVQGAVTFSKESAIAQAQLSIANLKNNAMLAMHRAQDFLTSKAETEAVMSKVLVDGTGSDTYYVPVCFMETSSEGNAKDRKCITPELYASQENQLQKTLTQVLSEQDFSPAKEEEQEMLQSYMQAEIRRNVPGNDSHSTRVRDMINKMFNK